MTPDWQDIKTAPKDGSEVLAYSREYGYWITANEFGCWAWPDHDTAVEPTHWLPIPDPPVQEPSDVE